MAERQYGQSFVFGSAGGASCSLRALFTPFTRRKTANATMRKLLISSQVKPHYGILEA
jgi:hypothetical protein